MKDSGVIIELMVEVPSGIRVVISILGNSSKIQPMAMEFIYIPTVRITRGNGNKTRKTVTAKRFGKMVNHMKVSTKTVSKTGTVYTDGPMGASSKGVGKTA